MAPFCEIYGHLRLNGVAPFCEINGHLRLPYTYLAYNIDFGGQGEALGRDARGDADGRFFRRHQNPKDNI